jgi:hypothetical protein
MDIINDLRVKYDDTIVKGEWEKVKVHSLFAEVSLGVQPGTA